MSTRKNEATRGVRAVVSGDRIDHVEVREGGGSVKADQVPRGRLWKVIKSTFICFSQAGEDIALYCLIGDDVHPYRTNYCDDPISCRARQLNRHTAEVPRASDRIVVNVTSSGSTLHNSDAYVIHGNRVFGNMGLQSGVMVSSRRISCACSKAKYKRKRRACCKCSGRCTTNYYEGRLRRGGVGQCVQGQGVFLFVRILQCCLAGRGQSGALNGRDVCALGVARAQADAP